MVHLFINRVHLFNIDPVRQLIENINVVNARKVEVVFKSGITVEEMLPEY